MSRSPDEVQAEIERARHQLSTTLDELVTRASPKRLVAEGKASVLERLNTPAGKAVIGTVAGVVVLLVVRRIRTRHSD